MARLYYFDDFRGNNSPTGKFVQLGNSRVWGTPTKNNIWFRGSFNGKSAYVRYDGNFNLRNQRTIERSRITGLANYVNGNVAVYLRGIRGVTIEQNNRALLSKSYLKKLKARIFEGKDTIIGGDSSDRLYGYKGNDYISGRGGRDVLNGGEGSDRFFGGSGNDLIIGGGGKDRLWGEGGKDTFRIEKGTSYSIIKDFSDGADRIQLGSGRSGLRLETRGDDALVYQRRDLMAIVEDAAGDLQRRGNYLV